MRRFDLRGRRSRRDGEPQLTSISISTAPPANPGWLLAHGEIVACQQLPWGSNYTFALALRDGDGTAYLAVYKPRRGEIPLWDFPDGTLYRREMAAYLTSQALGWDFIPLTVIRDGPLGVGSVQLYIDPVDEDYFQFRGMHRAELQRICLFDLLTNNADRKAGHCLKDRQGRIWAIDHGLTFHTQPKLRTVIWDFCGEPFPEPLVADLRAFLGDQERVAHLRAALKPLLAPAEIEGFFRRAHRLLAHGRYPELDPYRNVPWPLT